jgi:aminopeptidase-like protein
MIEVGGTNMKMGKLDVNMFDDPKLGRHFTIKCRNKDTKDKEAFYFDVKKMADGDELVLNITKQTALLLADYIDEQLNDETNWKE